MDTADEAAGLRRMDHGAVNAQVLRDFLWFANRGGQPALGNRTARIVRLRHRQPRSFPIELCKRAGGFAVVAIDLAQHMLDLAGRTWRAPASQSAILLERVDAKGTPTRTARSRTISNRSSTNHPGSRRAASRNVARHREGADCCSCATCIDRTETPRSTASSRCTAASPPQIRRRSPRTRTSARSSGRRSARRSPSPRLAAWSLPSELPASAVTMTSDRHWTLAYEKP